MNKYIVGLIASAFLVAGGAAQAQAAALTTGQANSLIAVVQSAPGVPASAFVNLITAFSNITVNQATSLIAVVQASPGTSANAFVNLLISFTVDTTVVHVETPTTGGTSFCHTFNYDLTVGSNGEDVSALKQALSASGITPFADGPDDYPNFGESTAGTVVQFQAKYGIRQTGYVGPLTRAKLNALYGCYKSQPQTVQPSPYVKGTFSYQQLYNSGVAGQMSSDYTYQIQNYRSGLVLDVEPTVNCNDTYIAPMKRDCSQYLFNLTGKAAESYSSVRGNPYVSGGASYRFTGANGQLYLNGFINPSYTPASGYTGATPDNIDFKFILRDLNQGGKEIWSTTGRAQFKG